MRGLLVIGVCLFALGVQGQQNLTRLLKSPGLKNAAIGIAINRVADGKMILGHNPEMALTPASVTKLLPTVLALQKKSSDFRYKTNIFHTGEIKNGILSGDIIVSAGGDPGFESRYFPDHLLLQPIIDTLKKAGVREVKGQIKVEGTKNGTDIPGSWTWEDVSNYYAALYLPFNYRDNTCIFELKTGGAGTLAQLKSVTPAQPGIKIINQVRASAENRDNAWIYGGPYSKELCIRGTVPQNRQSFRIKGAMHRPDLAFINELSLKLNSQGIVVKNAAGFGTQKEKLLTIYSPSLKEIVYHTNKSSVNLFAEALSKVVDSENWTEKAIEILKEAGISCDGVILKDACGLSPFNAIPAQVFTDLLIYAHSACGNDFIHSLPVAGKDAGLDGYCSANPALKGCLQAKTGSMSGVRCLAGFLITGSGERLAFTILINNYTCTSTQLQNSVGQFLSTYL